MYEEKRIKFDWKGFLIKLIIIIVLLIIIAKLFPLKGNKNQNKFSDVFEKNIVTLKETGNNYFNKDNLPIELGESNTISLKQLIKEKKIEKLKSANGKSCDNDKSYIKSTKKDIGYELEVYLKCDKEEDTSYVYLGCFDECTNGNTSTTKKTTKETSKKTTTKETSKKTTKKTTTKNSYVEPTTKKYTTTSKRYTTKRTTTKKYTTSTTKTTTTVKKFAVIFNTNGGSYVKTQYVVKNNKAVKPTNPTKTGYIFAGWELNGNIYNFNTPITENTILKAKWIIANQKSTSYNYYSTNVYSVKNISCNDKTVKTTDTLLIPSKIKNYKNVEIFSVDYVRNINTQTDLKMYYDLRSITFTNNSATDKYDINSFGSLNYIDLSHNGNNITWSAKVNNICQNSINETCNYGIIYNVIWKYQV